MQHSGFGRWLTTLAAGAALGLLLPIPLQAQQRPPLGAGTASRQALSTLQLVQVGKGSGVFSCKLGDLTICAIADHSTLPACVILIPPTPVAEPGVLETLARRFEKAYKLTDYRIAAAKDNSAAYLFREDRYGSTRESKGLSALAAEKSPATAIRWLNATCGNAPHRLEKGTCLVWRSTIAGNGNRRGIEITLNLLQSLPGYVDVRLRNINNSAACDLISDHLGLDLKPLSGSKGSAMRKKLGAKPLGYVKEKHLAGSLVLVRAGNESGHYRLGSPEALAAARGQEEQTTLPELPQAAWVDEAPVAPRPTPTTEAGHPTPAPAENNPAPTRPDRVADSSPPAATPPAPAAVPTPAEARQAYTERLRAL